MTLQVERARGYAWCVPSWWDRRCYIPLAEHEAAEVATLRRLFPSPPRREMTFVDIGANTGFYSVQLAVHFAHVVAFEPDSENAALLAVNAALNHCANVCVLPLAAWRALAPVSILIANPGIPMWSRAHWTTRGESDAPEAAEHDRQDRLLGLPLDAVPTAATVARDRPFIQMEIHNDAERRALQELLSPLNYRRVEVEDASAERELWGPS